MGILKRFAIHICLLTVFAASLLAQSSKNSGSLRGQITDPSGAVVVGAAVSVTGADGLKQNTVSDKQGSYVIHGLAAGNATVGVTATGFTAYQMANVIISAGQSQQLDIALGIAVKQEQVTVQSESTTVDVNPANNASATVLTDKDLEALSDDPDELEQDLLALAGPSAGPNGGQIYIDGFSNGTLPPKSSIREVRINQNPFSAEYDRPGFGRVEVFTKPGSDKWHGQAMFNENNSAVNSRNPYVHTSVPDYHSEIYSGNVSGALSKNVSVFFNGERRNINETTAIDQAAALAAGSLDAQGNPIQAVLAPRTRTNVSSRVDWQIAQGNTLTARYQFLKNNESNQGIGGLTVATRAYGSSENQHTLQLSDTQIINLQMINETRFQLINESENENAIHPNVAAINVQGEFNAGGNTIGNSWHRLQRYELQNYTSWSVGRHFVKFGGRLRVSHTRDLADSNYNGILVFNTLNDYASGAPSQFSVIEGNGLAINNFADAGLYAEDDWKLRPNLTLSYGMRFETQTGIGDKGDFAPRIGLSWGLGSSKSAPKTVLRLGYGIFYDRFGQDLLLEAQHENGVNQQHLIYNSGIQCPGSPTTANGCTLGGPESPSYYRINGNLRSPYNMQTAVSVERQLGKAGTVSLTYLNSRGVHQFITENINAPRADGSRPAGNEDNIFEYNSEAIFKQNQLIANLQLRVSQKFSLMGYYSLGYANSDSSGATSFPSDQYDTKQDYGRASFDVRNRLFLSGTASLAHNIRISPFVIANSGAPFNLVLAQDLNGDSIFNDRPSFAAPGTPLSSTVVSTQYGLLNLNPSSTEKRIPVNYGKGPANVTLNVRLSKTFGFGPDTKKPNAASPSQSGQGRGGAGEGRGGPGGGFGGGRGMGGLFASSNTTRRYNLTLTLMARNIFNTWNPGLPVGTIIPTASHTATFRSVGVAGGPFSSGSANRRVDFQAQFSF